MRSAWIISLVLHIILIMSVMISFYRAELTTHDASPIIHIYLYQQLQVSTPILKLAAEKKFIQRVTPAKKHSTASPSRVVQHEKTTTDPLLLLLHSAIQENVQYPSAVPEFVKDKKVLLSFTLYADGHITNLKILQSSGINIIDQAAASAVNNIQPVSAAKKYIKDQKEFELPVVFERV